jgi:uncharacterized protein YbjT (DUF2867 family)
MTILITGPSGAVGLPVIRHLVRRGARVRALTSKQASADNLKSLGVAEIIIGDFANDADVTRAMQGVASVMHIPPRFREDEAEIGLRVLKAAQAAKVDHFVVCSVFHPQLRQLAHHRNKLLVEEAVIESGLPFSIIQPAMFMQNLRIEWPAIKERGVYQRAYSTSQKMTLIDTEDLGEASARILTEQQYRGGTFELSSADSLTNDEMAAIITQEWGRPVRAEKQSLDDWKTWAAGRGWKPWAMDTYMAMCRHYDAHGYAGGSPVVLSAILGREPGGYRAFLKRFLAQQG